VELGPFGRQHGGRDRLVTGQFPQGVPGHREHEREDPQREDHSDRDRRQHPAKNEPDHLNVA
jgi:hypothetical protein